MKKLLTVIGVVLCAYLILGFTVTPNNESTTGKNHRTLTRKWENTTWVNPWAAPSAIKYYWFDTSNTWTGRYSTLQEEIDNTGCDPYLYNPKTLMFKGFTVGSIPGYENGAPVYPNPGTLTRYSFGITDV